ncbi:PAS domain-containing sensor histidine kinase [Limoniibacter endophyticus]|uniref:histidine kinase n=1 Tax=Limoniibacter endophyticus TaxID=1565040 RepID=A0A8J3DRE9_9HYPH|nr:sensor histidine kinase [Limoniibacter endophyticus]GHC76608.1 histidine kinase [Limoniibacter endophyticus]
MTDLKLETADSQTGVGLESTRDAAPSLLRSLRHSGISVLYQSPDLKTLWGENIPLVWTNESVVGKRDADIFSQENADKLLGLKQDVLRSGERQLIELQFYGKDGMQWFDIWIDLDRDDHGPIHGVVMTAIETTEKKLREQTLRTLLREVSHRSKNLLAIIQSVASQTGRYSESIEGFIARFRGRLQSLASSQDLVTSSNWRGADLHDLTLSQLSRYCADPDRNIRFTGKNPYLTPNAALHIGLALHELAVNSVSYGALRSSEGYVTLSVELSDKDNPQSDIVLTWDEKIRRDHPSQDRRFGSVALERVVPASLSGTAELRIDNSELVYRLIVPRNNFELDR